MIFHVGLTYLYVLPVFPTVHDAYSIFAVA